MICVKFVVKRILFNMEYSLIYKKKTKKQKNPCHPFKLFPLKLYLAETDPDPALSPFQNISNPFLHPR